MGACEDKYLLSCLGTAADKVSVSFSAFLRGPSDFFFGSKHECTVILRKKLMTTRLFLSAVPFSPQTSLYPPPDGKQESKTGLSGQPLLNQVFFF